MSFAAATVSECLQNVAHSPPGLKARVRLCKAVPQDGTLAEGQNTIQHHGRALVAGTLAQTVATLSHRVMLTMIDTQLDGWLPMHPELQAGRLFRGIPYLGHPAYHRPPLTSEGLRAQSKILDCCPLPWRPTVDNLLTLIPSRANQ